MIIDTLKGTSKPQFGYGTDDTDISEPETAVTTPTGSLTDSLLRRLSSCSSSLSSSSYTTLKSQVYQKHIPKSKYNQTEMLEQKVQLLESQIRHHIEREAELMAQVILLEQKSTYSSDDYKTTLSRVGNHIDQSLVSYDKQIKTQMDSSIWKENTDWSGCELLTLFDSEIPMAENPVHEKTESKSVAQYIVHLKTMVNQFSDQVSHMYDDQSVKKKTLNFCSDLQRTLDSTWSHTKHTFILDTYEYRNNLEKDRVVHLMNALQKSLQRNTILQKEYAVQVNQYKTRLDSIMQELAQSRSLVKKQSNERQASNERSGQEKNSDELDIYHASCQKVLQETSTMFEAQVKDLEMTLLDCQEERDEFEKTLEMVRREMETMLEELEDTRQQRVRYKTQANRLRAGIEAIQKRKKQRLASDSEENEDEDEDEQKESMRLLYNEAERQAVDLERECKRQALTLNSLRQELKMMDEKYQTIKTEKAKELRELEIENGRVKRQVKALELEKRELCKQEEQQRHQKQQQQNQETQKKNKGASIEYREIDENDLHYYTLQVTLEAAQADAVLQRSRIYHLEKRCLITKIFDETLQEIRGIFKKGLEREDAHSTQLIKQIKAEQQLWRNDTLREFQKKYDTDVIRATREIRFLSAKISEIEDEIAILKDQHLNELTLLQKEHAVETEKKIQTLVTQHRSKEEELKKESEVLFQQVQKLQDESLVLYGRNMIMAHELGKFA